MVTKTHLKPTYLPTYLCNSSDSCDSCCSSESSESSDSSDSSDQTTYFSNKKTFFSQKNPKKTFFTKNIFLPNKSKCDQNQTQNVTKLKNSKFDRTQKLKQAKQSLFRGHNEGHHHD